MTNKISDLSLSFDELSAIDEWVFGRFLVIIDGQRIGNAADCSVDMKGCLHWWLDLVKNPRNRYEPGLYEDNKDNVFRLLASSVLVAEDIGGLVPECFSDSFARFHISHVGMSSFNCVTMLFVKNELGLERLIWRDSDQEVREAYFAENQLEQLFLDASADLKNAIANIQKK